MAGTPNRGTAQLTVDQWNEAMRASPLYQNFVQQRGLSTSRGGWSRGDQAAWERTLQANGIPIPSGMHIDQGGNLNQKNTLGRNAIITGAVAAAALTGFGLAGMGPLSGLSGAGAAGGAGTVGGTTAIHAVPPAVTAAGTGAGGWATQVPWLAGVGGTTAIHAVPPAVTAAGTGAGGWATQAVRPPNVPLGGVARPGAGGGDVSTKNPVRDFFTDPKNLLSLAPLIGSLATRGGGANGGIDNEFLKQAYADAQRNNAMKEARFRRVDPLHEAVTQLAFNRMPTTNGTNGIALNRVPLPPERG